MAGNIQELNESLVIRSLRRFRDRYFPQSGKLVRDHLTPGDTGEEEPGFLDSLPVRRMRIIKHFFFIRASKFTKVRVLLFPLVVLKFHKADH